MSVETTNTFIRPDEIDGDLVSPKYHQIHAQLKKELYFNPYESGRRFLSLRDLKARYQVDMDTVRSAIELLISEGFLTKKPASGLYVNGRSNRAPDVSMGTIWFYQPGGRDEPDGTPYYHGILNALQHRASIDGLNVTINREPGLEDFFRWFKPETGDGLVLTGNVDLDLVNRLDQEKTSRYVVVGNYDLPEGTPNVYTRIAPAVEKAVMMAERAGRKTLGAIAAEQESRSIRDLIEGVEAAVRTSSIQFVGGVFGGAEDGHKGMVELEKRGVDCVLASENAYFGLCRYVFERGITCPEELFVIRYGKNVANEAYDDVASVDMTSDKDELAGKIIDNLFHVGSARLEIDIAVKPRETSRGGRSDR